MLGVDFSPTAIEQARENAADKGVDARFEVADAMNLGGDPAYDTIVDSALFHIFDDADRPRYVSSLHAGTRPGALVYVLALSDAGRGFGPEVSERQIREALAEGWVLEALDTTAYRGVVGEPQADAVGLPAGTVVDEPAWLARAAGFERLVCVYRRSPPVIPHKLLRHDRQSMAARMWGTGALAAAARCWTSASSSMLECTSSGGPVRRINARRCPPATASNAHVVRLAPPVRARSFSTTAPSPTTGRNTDSSRSFIYAQNRRAAGPPGGSGSPRRLR